LTDLANPVDYVERVNRAIDHVTRHLAEPLPLEDVARVACFSPYHFHRIFRAVTGETLHAFVKRVRLERALFLRSHEPAATLTEIAFRCGFSSSSDFSRSFRQHFGSPPSDFDLAGHRAAGRDGLVASIPADHRVERLAPGTNPDGFVVRYREVPARRVAYVRVMRPYSPSLTDAVERLLAWARERGLEGGQWLGYQWDDPELVPLDQCRYDVGLEIPADAVVERDSGVSATRFDAMKLAEVALDGDISLELRALEWLFGTWLPRSGYAPDHQPVFEAWTGLPFAHGTERFVLRVQLAIVDR
jgi:AraC family transcriptional regulator